MHRSQNKKVGKDAKKDNNTTSTSQTTPSINNNPKNNSKLKKKKNLNISSSSRRTISLTAKPISSDNYPSVPSIRIVNTSILPQNSQSNQNLQNFSTISSLQQSNLNGIISQNTKLTNDHITTSSTGQSDQITQNSRNNQNFNQNDQNFGSSSSNATPTKTSTFSSSFDHLTRIPLTLTHPGYNTALDVVNARRIGKSISFRATRLSFAFMSTLDMWDFKKDSENSTTKNFIEIGGTGMKKTTIKKNFDPKNLKKNSLSETNLIQNDGIISNFHDNNDDNSNDDNNTLSSDAYLYQGDEKNSLLLNSSKHLQNSPKHNHFENNIKHQKNTTNSLFLTPKSLAHIIKEQISTDGIHDMTINSLNYQEKSKKSKESKRYQKNLKKKLFQNHQLHFISAIFAKTRILRSISRDPKGTNTLIQSNRVSTIGSTSSNNSGLNKTELLIHLKNSQNEKGGALFGGEDHSSNFENLQKLKKKLGTPESNPDFTTNLMDSFSVDDDHSTTLAKMGAIFKQLPRAVPKIHGNPSILPKKLSENEELFEKWMFPPGDRIGQIDMAFINSLSLSDHEKLQLLQLSYNGVYLNPHRLTEFFGLNIDALTIGSRDILHDQLLSLYFRQPGAIHPNPRSPAHTRRLNHLDQLLPLPVTSEGTIQVSTKSNFTNLFPLEHLDEIASRFRVDIATTPGYSILNTRLQSDQEKEQGVRPVSDPIVTESISQKSLSVHSSHYDYATGRFYKGTIEENKINQEDIDDVYKLIKHTTSIEQDEKKKKKLIHHGFDPFISSSPQNQIEFQTSLLSAVTLSRTQFAITQQLISHLTMTVQDYQIHGVFPRFSEFFLEEYDPSGKIKHSTASPASNHIDSNEKSIISAFSHHKQRRIIQVLSLLTQISSPQINRLLFRDQFLSRKLDQLTEFVLSNPNFANLSKLRRTTNLLTRAYDVVLPPRTHTAILIGNHLGRDDETANVALRRQTHLITLKAHNYLTGNSTSDDDLEKLVDDKLEEEIRELGEGTVHRSLVVSISPLISPPHYVKHHPDYYIHHNRTVWDHDRPFGISFNEKKGQLEVNFDQNHWETIQNDQNGLNFGQSGRFGRKKGHYGSGEYKMTVPGTVNLTKIPHLGLDYALPSHLPTLEALCFDCIGNNELLEYFRDFNEKKWPILRDIERNAVFNEENGQFLRFLDENDEKHDENDQNNEKIQENVQKVVLKGRKREKLTKDYLRLLPPTAKHFVHLLTSPLHFGNFSTRVYKYKDYAQNGQNGRNGRKSSKIDQKGSKIGNKSLNMIQNDENYQENDENGQNLDENGENMGENDENDENIDEILFVSADTAKSITPGMFLGLYLNTPQPIHPITSSFYDSHHQSSKNYGQNGQNYGQNGPNNQNLAPNHTHLPIQPHHVLSIDLYRCLHDQEYMLVSFAHIFTDIFDLSASNFTNFDQNLTQNTQNLTQNRQNQHQIDHTQYVTPYLPPISPKGINFHPNEWSKRLNFDENGNFFEENDQNDGIFSKNSKNSKNLLNFHPNGEPIQQLSQPGGVFTLDTPLGRRFKVQTVDDIAILPLLNPSGINQTTHLQKHLHSLSTIDSIQSHQYDEQMRQQNDYFYKMEIYYQDLSNIEGLNNEIYKENKLLKKENKKIKILNNENFKIWEEKKNQNKKNKKNNENNQNNQNNDEETNDTDDDSSSPPIPIPLHTPLPFHPLPTPPPTPTPLPTDVVGHITQMSPIMSNYGTPIGATQNDIVNFGVLQSGIKYRWLQASFEVFRYEYIKTRYRNAEDLGSKNKDLNTTAFDGNLNDIKQGNRVQRLTNLQQTPTERKRLRLLRGDDGLMTKIKTPRAYGKDLSDDEWQNLRAEDEEEQKWKNNKKVKYKYDEEGRQIGQDGLEYDATAIINKGNDEDGLGGPGGDGEDDFDMDFSHMSHEMLQKAREKMMEKRFINDIKRAKIIGELENRGQDASHLYKSNAERQLRQKGLDQSGKIDFDPLADATLSVADRYRLKAKMDQKNHENFLKNLQNRQNRGQNGQNGQNGSKNDDYDDDGNYIGDKHDFIEIGDGFDGQNRSKNSKNSKNGLKSSKRGILGSKRLNLSDFSDNDDDEVSQASEGELEDVVRNQIGLKIEGDDENNDENNENNNKKNQKNKENFKLNPKNLRKLGVDDVADLLDQANLREVELDDIIETIDEYKATKTKEINEDPLLTKYKKSLYDPLSLLPVPTAYSIEFIRGLIDLSIYEEMWCCGNDVSLESTEVIANSLSKLGYPELSLALLPITTHNTYTIYSSNTSGFVTENGIRPDYQTKLHPTISQITQMATDLQAKMPENEQVDITALQKTRIKVVDPFLGDQKTRWSQMDLIGITPENLQKKKMLKTGQIIPHGAPNEILISGIAEQDEEYRGMMIPLVSNQFIMNTRHLINSLGQLDEKELENILIQTLAPRLHQKRCQIQQKNAQNNENVSSFIDFREKNTENDQKKDENNENDQKNDKNGGISPENESNIDNDPLTMPISTLLDQIHIHTPLTTPSPYQITPILTKILEKPFSLEKFHLFVKPSLKFPTQYQKESVLTGITTAQERYSLKTPSLSAYDSDILSHIQQTIIDTIHQGGSMATVQVISKLRSSLRDVMLKRLRQKLDIFMSALQHHGGRVQAAGMVSSHLQDVINSGGNIGMGNVGGGKGGKRRGGGAGIGGGGGPSQSLLSQLFKVTSTGNMSGSGNTMIGGGNSVRYEASMTEPFTIDPSVGLTLTDDGPILLDVLFRNSIHGKSMILDAKKKQPAYDQLDAQNRVQKQLISFDAITKKQTQIEKKLLSLQKKNLNLQKNENFQNFGRSQNDNDYDDDEIQSSKGKLYQLDPNDSGTEFTSDDEDVRAMNKKYRQNTGQNGQNLDKNLKKKSSTKLLGVDSIASQVNSLQQAVETSLLDPVIIEQQLEQGQPLYKRLQPGFSAPISPVSPQISEILPIFTQPTPFLSLGVTEHTSNTAIEQLKTKHQVEGEFPSVTASILGIEAFVNAGKYQTALDLLIQTLQRFSTHRELIQRHVTKYGAHQSKDSRVFNVARVDKSLLPVSVTFPHPVLFTHGFMLCQALGDWSTGLWLLAYAKQYRFCPSLSQLSQLAESSNQSLEIPSMAKILQIRMKAYKKPISIVGNSSGQGSGTSISDSSTQNTPIVIDKDAEIQAEAMLVKTKTLQHLRQQVGKKLWLTTKASIIRSKTMTLDVPFVLSILQLYHTLDDAMQLFWEAMAWPIHVNTKFFLKFQQHLNRIQIEYKHLHLPAHLAKVAGTTTKVNSISLSMLTDPEKKQINDINDKFQKIDEYLQFLMSKIFSKQFKLYQKLTLDNINLLDKLHQIQLDHRLSHAQSLGDVSGALRIVHDLHRQQLTSNVIGFDNLPENIQEKMIEKLAKIPQIAPNGQNLSQFKGLTSTHWGYVLGAIVNKWKNVNISQENSTLAQALMDPTAQKVHFTQTTGQNGLPNGQLQSLNQQNDQFNTGNSQNGHFSSIFNEKIIKSSSTSSSASKFLKTPRFVLTLEQQQDLLLAQRIFMHCLYENKLEDHHLWVNLMKTFNIFFDSASILGLTQFLFLMNGQNQNMSFLPFNLNQNYDANHWNQHSFTHYPITWSSIDEARDRISKRQRGLIEKEKKNNEKNKENEKKIKKIQNEVAKSKKNMMMMMMMKKNGDDDDDDDDGSDDDYDDDDESTSNSKKGSSKRSKNDQNDDKNSQNGQNGGEEGKNGENLNFFAPDFSALEDDFAEVDAENFNSTLLGSYSFRVKAINQKNIWNALDLDWNMQDLIGDYQIKNSSFSSSSSSFSFLKNKNFFSNQKNKKEIKKNIFFQNDKNFIQSSSTSTTSRGEGSTDDFSNLELNLYSLLGNDISGLGEAPDSTLQLIQALRSAKEQNFQKNLKKNQIKNNFIEEKKKFEKKNFLEKNDEEKMKKKLYKKSYQTNSLFGYVLPWTLNDRLRLQSSLDSLQGYLTFYYSKLQSQRISIPTIPSEFAKPIKHGPHTLSLVNYEQLIPTTTNDLDTMTKNSTNDDHMTKNTPSTINSPHLIQSNTFKTPQNSQKHGQNTSNSQNSGQNGEKDNENNENNENALSSPYSPTEIASIGPKITPIVNNHLNLGQFPTTTHDSYQLEDLQNSFPTLHTLNPIIHTTPDRVIDASYITEVAQNLKQSPLHQILNPSQPPNIPQTLNTQDLSHGLINQHPILSLFSPLHTRVVNNNVSTISADILNIALPHLARVSPVHAFSTLLWMINSHNPHLDSQTRKFKRDYVDKYGQNGLKTGFSTQNSQKTGFLSQNSSDMNGNHQSDQGITINMSINSQNGQNMGQNNGQNNGQNGQNGQNNSQNDDEFSKLAKYVEVTSNPSPLDVIESLQRPFVTKRVRTVISRNPIIKKQRQKEEENNENDENFSEEKENFDENFEDKNNENFDENDQKNEDFEGNYHSSRRNDTFINSDGEEQRSIFALDDSDLDFNDDDVEKKNENFNNKKNQKNQKTLTKIQFHHNQTGDYDPYDDGYDNTDNNDDDNGNYQVSKRQNYQKKRYNDENYENDGIFDENYEKTHQKDDQEGDLLPKDIFADTLGEAIASTSHTISLPTSTDAIATSPETQHIINHLPSYLTQNLSQQEQLRYIQLAKINNELLLNGYSDTDIAGVILSTARALFSHGYYGLAMQAYNLTPPKIENTMTNYNENKNKNFEKNEKNEKNKNDKNLKKIQGKKDIQTNSSNDSLSLLTDLNHDTSTPLPTSLLDTSATDTGITNQAFSAIYHRRNPPMASTLTLNNQYEPTNIITLSVKDMDPIHANLYVRSQLQDVIMTVVEKMVLHQKTFHIAKTQLLAKKFQREFNSGIGQNGQNDENNGQNDENEQNNGQNGDFSQKVHQNHQDLTETPTTDTIPDDVHAIFKALQQQTAASSYNPYSCSGLVIVTGDFITPDRTLQESLVYHFNKEFNPTVYQRSLDDNFDESSEENDNDENFFDEEKKNDGSIKKNNKNFLKNSKNLQEIKQEKRIISRVPVVIDMLYPDNTTSTVYNQQLLYGNSLNTSSNTSNGGNMNENNENNGLNSQNDQYSFETMYKYLFDGNNTGSLIITPYTITNLAYNIFSQLVTTTGVLDDFKQMEQSIKYAAEHITGEKRLKKVNRNMKFMMKKNTEKNLENTENFEEKKNDENENNENFDGEMVDSIDSDQLVVDDDDDDDSDDSDDYFNPNDISNGQEYLRRLGEIDIANIISEQFYENLEKKSNQNFYEEEEEKNNNKIFYEEKKNNENKKIKNSTSSSSSLQHHIPPLQPTVYSWWQPTGDPLTSAPSAATSSSSSSSPSLTSTQKHKPKLHLFAPTSTPVPKQHINGTTNEPDSVQVVNYLWTPPNVTGWFKNSHFLHLQQVENDKNKAKMEQIRREAIQKYTNERNNMNGKSGQHGQHGQNRQNTLQGQNNGQNGQNNSVFSRQDQKKQVSSSPATMLLDNADSVAKKILQTGDSDTNTSQQQSQQPSLPSYLRVRTAGMIDNTVGGGIGSTFGQTHMTIQSSVDEKLTQNPNDPKNIGQKGQKNQQNQNIGQNNQNSGQKSSSPVSGAAAIAAAPPPPAAAPAPRPGAGGGIGFGQYSNYYKTNSAFSSGPPQPSSASGPYTKTKPGNSTSVSANGTNTSGFDVAKGKHPQTTQRKQIHTRIPSMTSDSHLPGH